MSNDAFLILFLVLIALMTLIPLFLQRFKIPSIIALLLVGMLIGKNGLDLLGHLAPCLEFLGTPAKVVEAHSMTLINSLGSLGLLFLMMLAGMEADFKLFKANRKPVILLSILTFLLPAVSGYLVYAYFKQTDFPGKLLYASLFASHSVGIVFPIIRELKLTKTFFGAAILISTIITDIASIVLLAVSVQLKKLEVVNLTASNLKTPNTLSLFDYIDPAIFGNYFTVFFLLVVLVYFLVVLLLVPRIGSYALKLFKGEDGTITCFLFIVLLTVLIGEFLGINLVVGAFLAGLALSRVMQNSWEIFRKFEGIGYSFLIPFLFISIGMQTNFRAIFSSPGNLQIILFTVIGLIVSKVCSGWISMRLSGYSNAEGLCAGVMTVPQLSATLAAAAIGKNLGMLDDNFFNAIIILSIITTLPVPNLVRFIIEHNKLTFAESATRVEQFELKEGQDDIL
ncbi:MAG: cation:proton antiporter [Lentisphaeria bacterium]|nr:cation:proton antiporter [Lentisphaeria bacterium]